MFQLSTDPFEGPIRENFDPYCDDEFHIEISQVSANLENSRFDSVSERLSLPSYYDMYLIVYSYLSKAVDAMVDTLETLKDNTLSSQDFTRLINCNVVSKPEYKSTSIQEENDEYYQLLIDMNLNNKNVQNYLIRGSVISPDDKGADFVENSFEVAREITEYLIAAIPISSDYSTHSIAAQTSFESYDEFQDILDVSETKDLPIQDVPPQEQTYEKDKDSLEQFYFKEYYPRKNY